MFWRQGVSDARCCPLQSKRSQRLEPVSGELPSPRFRIRQKYPQLHLGPIRQNLDVRAAYRPHGTFSRFVLRKGRHAPLEDARGGRGGLRVLLRGGWCDAELSRTGVCDQKRVVWPGLISLLCGCGLAVRVPRWL